MTHVDVGTSLCGSIMKINAFEYATPTGAWKTLEGCYLRTIRFQRRWRWDGSVMHGAAHIDGGLITLWTLSTPGRVLKNPPLPLEGTCALPCSLSRVLERRTPAST